MKIAYGTYATPMLSLEESLEMIKNIGYDGVEICISPKHKSMPEDLDAEKRDNLKGMLKKMELGVPALFMLGAVLNEDKKIHQERLELAKHVRQLAEDFDLGDTPVLSVGIGGKSNMWESHRNMLIDLLGDYSKVAEREDFILAIEAHARAMVDRSKRAIWVIETADSPNIKLHFDIVHFFLAGEPIAETVHKLVPYTGHTHITDAKIKEKGFELLLLGQGDLDSVEYVKAMHEAGWDDFITLEVSTMVWSKEEYDPVEAAEFSYNSLNEAFKEAGVPRI
ncbi:TIM barrel protein [Candidatus Poribacteria bacterium]|nr:TIM barrel protein [Candidatus Poribacteria bacterium]